MSTIAKRVVGRLRSRCAAPTAEKERRAREAVERTQRKQEAEHKERVAELNNRVVKAIAVIGADRADKRAIEQSVRFVRGMTAHLKSQRPIVKKEKLASASVASALRRLQAALKNPHVPKFVQDHFPHKEIKQWRSHCARHAKVALGKPKRRDAAAKRIAADEAALLLMRHGLPVRGGKHERLTAALYGDPGVKLSYASRLAKSAKPGLI